jgi:hypothetical protein
VAAKAPTNRTMYLPHASQKLNPFEANLYVIPNTITDIFNFLAITKKKNVIVAE